MTDNDFNGTPFAAGSLTGLRAFRIDKYGRLLASQLNVVWTPGENTGRCMREYMTRTFFGMPTLTACTCSDCRTGTSMHWPAISAPKAEKEPKPDLSHRAGKLDCTCGFYAYFDDQGNTYHHAGDTIQALIEGYGLTTTGARGFRAEKARVQALIIKPKYANAITDQVLINYPDVPVFDRKTDALDRFPLTRPPLPTPDTDADFWTRDAL